jgi:hypothetical protein
LDKPPKLRKMDVRFGTWNVRSLYRGGTFVTVAHRISKYEGNENHELGTGYVIHKRIIPPLKKAEFFSDNIVLVCRT